MRDGEAEGGQQATASRAQAEANEADCVRNGAPSAQAELCRAFATLQLRGVGASGVALLLLIVMIWTHLGAAGNS